jgi:hypothetical protein
MDEDKGNYSRRIEISSIAVVSKWVASRGIVTDTGNSNGPDFSISYFNGTTAVGEVGWHEDPVVAAAWNALRKRRRHHYCELEEGAGYWSLLISHNCNLNRLERELPNLIRQLNVSGLKKLDIYETYPRDSVSNDARSLGIIHLKKINEEKNEALYIFEGSGGVVPQDPNEIVPWINELLLSKEYEDSWKKMQHISADEKHVFIVGGSRTPFGISELLRRLDSAMPNTEPSLPGGITHLWISGIYLPATSIMWTRDSQWVKFEDN